MISLLEIIPSEILGKIAEMLNIQEIACLKASSRNLQSSLSSNGTYENYLAKISQCSILSISGGAISDSLAWSLLKKLHQPRFTITQFRSLKRWLHRASGPFIFGGRRNNQLLNELLFFETATRQFRLVNQEGDVPSPRMSQGMVHSGNKLVIFGGLTKTRRGIFGYTRDLYIGNIEENLDSGNIRVSWQQIHWKGPSKRWGFTMLLVGENIYLFGGSSEGKLFNDLWKLSPSGWTEVALGKEGPDPRSGHAALATEIGSLGVCMVITGGNTTPPNITTFQDIWVFSPLREKWFRVMGKQQGGPLQLHPRIGHLLVPLVPAVFLATTGRVLRETQNNFFVKIIEKVKLDFCDDQINGTVSERPLQTDSRTGAVLIGVSDGFIIHGGLGEAYDEDVREEEIEEEENDLNNLPPDLSDCKDSLYFIFL